jgi:hypothetical protein
VVFFIADPLRRSGDGVLLSGRRTTVRRRVEIDAHDAFRFSGCRGGSKGGTIHSSITSQLQRLRFATEELGAVRRAA